ncbi:MAG: 6-pyruvoyl trahydropterin synthase family protein [Flavobacteriaceae bacterium]|nr:6-pyruvoyl tetrahydrobiopterin synthase [Flavobacteriales bacterium]|tara:strand:- start:1905 stop:2312 length:408 start_codon:yes stop_codon:yes gene_type:complete
MEITVSRKAHFNAAHRLYNQSWSDKRNKEVFGKCNNPNYHGHNYELIVSVRGMINPETGYVIDMGYLKLLIKNEIEEILDHKNLNLDVPYFSNVIPSAENICVFIYDILRSKIEDNLNLSIRLYETPRNFVEYSG